MTEHNSTTNSTHSTHSTHSTFQSDIVKLATEYKLSNSSATMFGIGALAGGDVLRGDFGYPEQENCYSHLCDPYAGGPSYCNGGSANKNSIIK